MNQELMNCQYTNFDITISEAAGHSRHPKVPGQADDVLRYPVLATYRGLSGASTFNQDALNPVWRDRLVLLGDPYRTQGDALLAEVGSRLFSELIRDHVRDLWSQARSDLDDGGRLRLRLVLHPPAVAALPWETLHDPRRNQSFGADTRISLVRTQNLVNYVARPRPLEAALPLTVLLVTVDTPDGLAAHKESVQIRSAISKLPAGLVILEHLDGQVTIQNLRAQLLAVRPDILHIVGHGNEDGLLLWSDGAPALAPAATLRTVLQQAETVKLVFLNACLAGQVDSKSPFAGIAHQLLQSGLPAVIAMRYEIADRTAVTFAGSVYEALVSGPCRGLIDAAVSNARSSLYINDPNRVDYATPILWLNAENGRILPFDDEQSPSASAFSRSDWSRQQMWRSALRIDFRLAEKEAWYRCLPESVSDPLMPFEYQRRRRIVGLLLRILRTAVEEQEQGRAIDIRAIQSRLETFDEERRHIQNILDHCLNCS